MFSFISSTCFDITKISLLSPSNDRKLSRKALNQRYDRFSLKATRNERLGYLDHQGMVLFLDLKLTISVRVDKL